MKAKQIILGTFLYGALTMSMLTIESPEGTQQNLSSTAISQNTSEQFFAQATPGERRRVRRRTRRRVNRRHERRESAVNFTTQISPLHLA